MPLNVQQGLVDRAWELLSTDAVTAAVGGPGGLHKQSEAGSAGVVRDRVKVSPTEVPSLSLTTKAGGMQRPILSFGSGLGPDEFDFAWPIRIDLTLTLTHRSLVESEQTELEALVLGSLLVRGASLGLPWVAYVTPTRWTRELKTVGQTQRMVATHLITAECRPYLSQLVSDLE